MDEADERSSHEGYENESSSPGTIQPADTVPWAGVEGFSEPAESSSTSDAGSAWPEPSDWVTSVAESRWPTHINGDREVESDEIVHEEGAAHTNGI